MRTRGLVFWALLFQFVLLIPRVGSAQTAKDLEQKLLALNTSDWRTAFAVGSDVADAEPAAGFAAIKAANPAAGSASATSLPTAKAVRQSDVLSASSFCSRSFAVCAEPTRGIRRTN